MQRQQLMAEVVPLVLLMIDRRQIEVGLELPRLQADRLLQIPQGILESVLAVAQDASIDQKNVLGGVVRFKLLSPGEVGRGWLEFALLAPNVAAK